VALSGCSEPSTGLPTSAVLDESSHVLSGTGVDSFTRFDFGAVLAKGQSLTLTFFFINPTNGPLHITGLIPLTPCCSTVEAIPFQPIPPAGRCRIATTLQARADHVETKRVEFLLKTDSAARPTHKYALVARLYAGWEVRAPTEPSYPAPTNQSGRQGRRIFCYRVRGEGESLPEQVEAVPPLVVQPASSLPVVGSAVRAVQARLGGRSAQRTLHERQSSCRMHNLTSAFVGPTQDRPLADRVIFSYRDIEITLPAYDAAQARRGELLFHWLGGRTKSHSIFREMAPPPRVTPRSIVFLQSELRLSSKLILSSGDRPFRMINTTRRVQS
jgi:hypothetical protein